MTENGARGNGWKRRKREKETSQPPSVGWTRLASTTSDVATAQQSPGLPSLSTFSPSRREMGDPPRHHPPRAACRPRTPHLFQGHGSIPTSVRASVRTSVRKLAATAVMPVYIRDQPRHIARVPAYVTGGVRVSSSGNACQICDIELTGSRISENLTQTEVRSIRTTSRFAWDKSCPWYARVCDHCEKCTSNS